MTNLFYTFALLICIVTSEATIIGFDFRSINRLFRVIITIIAISDIREKKKKKKKKKNPLLK